MWADATPNKWTISSRLLGEPRASGEGIAPFPYSTHFFICAKHLAQIMLSIVSEPFCLLVFVMLQTSKFGTPLAFAFSVSGFRHTALLSVHAV